MCSKIFGKGTLDSILGDVVGGGLGFIAGGPLGAAVGAGLGGAAGESLGGGSLLQDIQAGGAGAALAGGVSTLADSALESGLSAGTGVAAGVAGDVAGDVAGGVVPAAASEAATAAPALAAAPGLISDAAGGATIAESAPLVSTYAPAVGLSAASEAAPTADAALGLDLSASPGASLGTAAPALGSTAEPIATTVAPLGGDAASPLDATLAAGQAGTLPGQTATAAQTALDLGGQVPVPPVPPTGGAIGAGISDFFSPVTTPISNAASGAGDFLTSPTGRVLSTAASGLGLARNLMTPNNIPGESQLQSLATQLGQQGTALEQQGAGLVTPNAAAASQVAGQATGQAATLENYLTSGTLPPAVQTALDQATNSAITDLKASYAARGESADPNSNSELAAGIASLQQNAIISGGTLAASLYSQGVSLDQLASGIYTNLVGAGTAAAQAGVGATQTGVGAQESVVSTNTAQNTAVNNSIANLSAALGGGSHAIVNGNTISIPAAA